MNIIHIDEDHESLRINTIIITDDMQINQPSNQIKLTNVSLVRMKKGT